MLLVKISEIPSAVWQSTHLPRCGAYYNPSKCTRNSSFRISISWFWGLFQHLLSLGQIVIQHILKKCVVTFSEKWPTLIFKLRFHGEALLCGQLRHADLGTIYHPLSGSVLICTNNDEVSTCLSVIPMKIISKINCPLWITVLIGRRSEPLNTTISVRTKTPTVVSWLWCKSTRPKHVSYNYWNIEENLP